MDRRTTVKWMLAAATTLPLRRLARAFAAETGGEVNPYGSDPKLLEIYHPGELWPLTLTPELRGIATILSDTIIPADGTSPSASAVGVVDFIDEWISAPYPAQRADRTTVLKGLAWIDAEARRRFAKPFRALDTREIAKICDDICWLPEAKAEFVEAATFFARYRDLTAGGFYSAPAGRQDLQYVGNLPLQRFDGPPLEVLKKAGLA
jgi:hypothetical protein